MASVRAYLRSLVEIHDEVGEILRHANAFLAREIELGRYVTLFFGRLEPDSFSIQYANAGHPTGYVLDRTGALKARLPGTTMPLGIDADMDFPVAEIPFFDVGDILLLLTDGVTEAEGPDGAPFGVSRTLEVIRKNRNGSADEIIAALRNAICDYSQSTAFSDDVTAVIVKRVPIA
jgi:phosphoserine phosphatase RsbU/P